jgi:Type-IV b secretion system, inner-membrane complex component
MTPGPFKAVPKKKAPVDQKKQSPAVAGAKAVKKKHGFFASVPVTVDFVANEEAEDARNRRMQSMVYAQTVAMTVLVGAFVLLAPVLKPIYHYYARDPADNVMALDPLIMPNMTDHAVISWAITSVTEVMTFGFGDMIPHLSLQKPRFTTGGWDSFVTAFNKQKINETFKENQLVLTTVPSDTAVILSQGQNEMGVYQWRIQVPVIMTYATNNNVSQPHRGVITLTIVRVRPDQNPSGIAIKKWFVNT